MTNWRDTPGSVGFLPAATSEAKVAVNHARLAEREPKNLDDMKLHAGHVINALDPSVEPKGPGAGYGSYPSSHYPAPYYPSYWSYGFNPAVLNNPFQNYYGAYGSPSNAAGSSSGVSGWEPNSSSRARRHASQAAAGSSAARTAAYRACTRRRQSSRVRLMIGEPAPCGAKPAGRGAVQR